MDYVTAIVLAIIEGITEFLPVSSTGHTILAAALLGVAQTPFVKSFELALEFGSILAVIVLYWRYFLKPEVLKRLAVAFIPTGAIGLLAYQFFKSVLLGNLQVTLWAMGLGGILLMLFEWRYRERGAVDDVSRIPYKHCLLIGAFQTLSIIPGVSRSAPTIIGGLALGMKRQTIVLFSFLLAVPTMIAASCFDLLNSYNAIQPGQWGTLLVGLVTAFLVAMPSIKLFLNYIGDNTFTLFGAYRVAVSAVFFLLVIV